MKREEEIILTGHFYVEEMNGCLPTLVTDRLASGQAASPRTLQFRAMFYEVTGDLLGGNPVYY